MHYGFDYETIRNIFVTFPPHLGFPLFPHWESFEDEDKRGVQTRSGID
jgi:hypothetical protein